MNKSFQEGLFQIALFVLVFIFYSFDREQPQIQVYQVVFFLNYAFGVLLINFVLLPRYFYKKRYIHFLVGIVLVITLVLVVEELVLEQIYFPDTRGADFQNVFYLLLDVLPIITILSGFKFAWDAITKQREVEKLTELMQQSELSFLKSQINPHFLFNNLNNLYSYALENSPKTPKIILELSSVLRYMLYECQEKYVPLSNELRQLENFIRLNELQIEERGKVNYSFVDVGQGFRIAPLILLVFVENAFKHSTENQSEEITIDIQVNLNTEGVLNFSCTNSYINSPNKDALTEGIGLQNVKKRLDLIYPDAYSLQIEELPKLYKVELSLDLN